MYILHFKNPCQTGYACKNARRKFDPSYQTTTSGAPEAPEINAAPGSTLPEAFNASVGRPNNIHEGRGGERVR